jgi:hypothetical protein
MKISGAYVTEFRNELQLDISRARLEDYIRNLKTALNQTFRSMNIKFEGEEKKRKTTLADFM